MEYTAQYMPRKGVNGPLCLLARRLAWVKRGANDGVQEDDTPRDVTTTYCPVQVLPLGDQRVMLSASQQALEIAPPHAMDNVSIAGLLNTCSLCSSKVIHTESCGDTTSHVSNQRHCSWGLPRHLTPCRLVHRSNIHQALVLGLFSSRAYAGEERRCANFHRDKHQSPMAGNRRLCAALVLGLAVASRPTRLRAKRGVPLAIRLGQWDGLFGCDEQTVQYGPHGGRVHLHLPRCPRVKTMEGRGQTRQPDWATQRAETSSFPRRLWLGQDRRLNLSPLAQTKSVICKHANTASYEKREGEHPIVKTRIRWWFEPPHHWLPPKERQRPIEEPTR
ncbi:hypothetical protein J3F83DRAFT_316589 [Trichoderma novae-zelandiae]